MNRLFSLLLLGAVLGAGGSCDRPQRRDSGRRRDGPHPGVIEIEPSNANLPSAAGQMIYVPVYSAIPTADNSRLYQLAITLSVRNTDRIHPIVIIAVRYYDQDGRLIRDFLKKPLRVAPMAAMEFFIREGDSSGGTSASFLVEWDAERVVSDPIVEAVMVGTTGSQGVSFTCSGRVVADQNR